MKISTNENRGTGPHRAMRTPPQKKGGHMECHLVTLQLLCITSVITGCLPMFGNTLERECRYMHLYTHRTKTHDVVAPLRQVSPIHRHIEH